MSEDVQLQRAIMESLRPTRAPPAAPPPPPRQPVARIAPTTPRRRQNDFGFGRNSRLQQDGILPTIHRRSGQHQQQALPKSDNMAAIPNARRKSDVPGTPPSRDQRTYSENSPVPYRVPGENDTPIRPPSSPQGGRPKPGALKTSTSLLKGWKLYGVRPTLRSETYYVSVDASNRHENSTEWSLHTESSLWCWQQGDGRLRPNHNMQLLLKRRGAQVDTTLVGVAMQSSESEITMIGAAINWFPSKAPEVRPARFVADLRGGTVFQIDFDGDGDTQLPSASIRASAENHIAFRMSSEVEAVCAINGEPLPHAFPVNQEESPATFCVLCVGSGTIRNVEVKGLGILRNNGNANPTSRMTNSSTPPSAVKKRLPNSNISNGSSKPSYRSSNGTSTYHRKNEESNNTTSETQFHAMIEAEILDRSPNVEWDDVAALGDAKRLLNEAVTLPLLVPEFFTGIRTPWKGVLLFGPPGTGKTLLAKAVATASNTTFFSMSASTLLSRYHGESEKLVKALFDVARKKAPSTIFLDEVDALLSKRGEGNEHEVSRRLKAEMLQQIDGVSVTGDERVMVLCTTNRPWDLDEAVRRRLEKRIYIPLPDGDARRSLLSIHTRSMVLGDDVDLSRLASGEHTDGFSGADLQIVCREAAMMPMRRAIDGKSPQDIIALKAQGRLDPGSLHVTQTDFLTALQRVSPSVSQNELHLYSQWQREFGST